MCVGFVIFVCFVCFLSVLLVNTPAFTSCFTFFCEILVVDQPCSVLAQQCREKKRSSKRCMVYTLHMPCLRVQSAAESTLASWSAFKGRHSQRAYVPSLFLERDSSANSLSKGSANCIWALSSHIFELLTFPRPALHFS